MTTRQLAELRSLKDNEGYRYVISILQKDLDAVANDLEILSDGADRTIALAAKFGAFRRAIRVMREEPDRAAELLELWVQENPDKAGGVIGGMASYDVD